MRSRNSIPSVLSAIQTACLPTATDGTYHQAASATALTNVYKSVDLSFKRVKKPREITAAFAGAGALLLAVGSMLSILWLGRVV